MMETDLEEGEDMVPKNVLVCDGRLGNCRCSELEEMSKKVEARYGELELEVQKRQSEYEALETKFRALEAAKIALEEELKAFMTRNNEVGNLISQSDNEEVVGYGRKGVKEGVVDLTEENDEKDKIFQLMTENRALECEKSKAENEVEKWKQKVKELESLKDANCYAVACGKKTSEAVKLKDGSQIVTTLNDMPTIDKAVSFMDSRVTLIFPGNSQPRGTPLRDTPYEHLTSEKGDYRVQSSKRVRRHLAFQEAISPSKQIAPSTPAGGKPASGTIIDIYDSDDEPDLAHNQIHTTSKQEKGDANISINNELHGTVGSENETSILGDQDQEANVGSFVDIVSFSSVPKRKRASNIVTSDTESDDDDNIPIAKLRRMRCKKVIPDQTSIKSKGCLVSATPPAIDNVRGNLTSQKRRLVSLRQAEGKVKNCPSRKISESRCCRDIPKTEDVEDDDSEDIVSDSSTDSLSGFIVDDSDIADCENGSRELDDDSSDCNNADNGQESVSSGSNACSGSTDVSDDDVDFDVILSTLKRNIDHKSDWKYEGDMLAAFGKDLELCMKAVCALYRQQTSDEKLSKATIYHNQRGFSQIDAERGCTLAEFLTDGDPRGDLEKSVEELQAYDPDAVELCRHLATKYSKQLFEIYNSKEDPYFRPS